MCLLCKAINSCCLPACPAVTQGAVALQVEWVAARVQEQTALLEAKQPLTLSLEALRVGLVHRAFLCTLPFFLASCTYAAYVGLCPATLNQVLLCSNSKSPMSTLLLAV